MKVKLNKWQYEVASDQHRFKVICAGRRSGKSVLARLTLLKWALTNIGTYYLVSPTYKQAKSIHWVELRKEVPRNWIAKSNETELSIQPKNGSIIELKGAENPDALRGIKLRGLVIDEIASIRNWDWLWEEVLRPTLTDYEAPAIFISTPKGYNHFFDLFQQGQTENNDYKSWRFTSYDNPWEPSRDPGGGGYVVERSPSAGCPFERLVRLEGRHACVYVDRELGDLRVFYYGSPR